VLTPNVAQGGRIREGWKSLPVTATDPLAPLEVLPGVAEAVDATRAAMDGLLREPALRRRRGEVRAGARLSSAWASAALAGCHLLLDEFAPPFSDDDSGRVAEASLQLASEVGPLADVWRRAPLQALARLHSVATAGWVDESDRGRPRPEPGVAERLSTLADTVMQSRASGVVASAVVHGELMTVRPFGSADDLVARAASRVVLVQRGVDPDALTVPEMGLVELGADAYRDALAGFTGGTSSGLAHWIAFHAAALQRGAAFTRTLCP
jgi:hypothetical protein